MDSALQTHQTYPTLGSALLPGQGNDAPIPYYEPPTVVPTVGGDDGTHAPIPYHPIHDRQNKESTGGGPTSGAGISSDVKDAPQPWYRQRRWIIVIAAVSTALIALVVGLSVGLTRGSTAQTPGPPSGNTTNSTSICSTGNLCRSVLTGVSFGSPASIFVFALGEDRSVFYRRGDGVATWTSDWISLNGSFVSPPVAIGWSNVSTPYLSAFALGSSLQNILIKSYQNGKFESSWTDLGVSGSRSHLSLCTVEPSKGVNTWVTNGPDDSLSIYHKFPWPDGSHWTDDVNYWPRYREAKLASALGVVCRNSSAYHDIVVYTQVNGSVSHTQFSANWSAWNNRGGSFIGDPVLVGVGNDRIDFFGIGVDKAMYHFTWTTQGGYTALDSLGGSFASIPSVVVSKDGERIDVVVLGRDSRVKHRVLQGSVWGPEWEDLGGFGNSAPLAVYVDSNPQHVALFVIGEHGDLAFTSWAVTENTSWLGLPPWTSLGGNFSVNYNDGLLPVNAVDL